MQPGELDRLREKAEAAGVGSDLAEAARATVQRHLEGADFATRLSGPLMKDIEAAQSPALNALATMEAVRERAALDLHLAEPRPVVVVPSPENEMAGHLAAMRSALAESNKREAESLQLAKDAERREEETRQRAERRERWMMAMTAVALILAAVPVALLIISN